MPGNDLGDRVHNFFAQDNSSQGQHQSHVLEGNWPVLNSNFWVGSQRQIDILNSNSRNHPAQNSEVDRGHASYPVHASNGLNFSQSNPRPDISKNQYINEQQYSNGVVYGTQLYQNRQNEANFLAMDTDSNQHHLMSSRGLSIQEAQQGSVNEQEKASDRSETSIAPVSFDLFGGQTQMNNQQASMLQALQRQQSGLSDMQQLQQQIMIRKIQEFQMQQQLKQLDSRPHDLLNQVPPLSKQTSGSQSSNLVNGTSNSDVFWTAEPGKTWLSCSSSAMQGSSSGLVFPPNLAQTQRLMDLVPQQVDRSLYGVPVSGSRGLAVNQYSQMVTERSSMPQMATFSNSLNFSQQNFSPDQIGGHEGTSVSRSEFQNENIGHASSQPRNTGMIDRGGIQQVNLMQINALQQHFARRQDLATQSETSHEKSVRQVSSSPNEVPLDPAEEKILFGSDDNLWDAFGKSPNGEASNLFDNGALSNEFASVQSGSWSALMQSAVAETSSSDISPQEEWSGLNFHSTDGSLANQPTSMHNDYVKKASSPKDIRIPSALGSGSIRFSEDIHAIGVNGSNQFGHKLQKESDIKLSTDTSQIFKQSFDEANKRSNRSPLQKSVAGGSQIYVNASQHSLDAERTSEKAAATWVPGQSGTKLERNGWNAMAAIPPGGDRVFNNEAELSQKSQNNRLMVMQGGVHGSSLWKSSPVTSSTEFGPVKVGNHLADKGLLSLNDTSASVVDSFNMGVGDGTSSFVQNSDVLNQWKSAYAPVKFQGSEGWKAIQDQVNEHNQGLDSLNRGAKDEFRRHDMDSSLLKENSNDSHRSNLSQHASGSFIEIGLTDASDSRSLLLGKQKLTNSIATKNSVPRKFQYHPLGNSDEDVEPNFGLKQPTQVHGSSLQNSHFGQSSQVSRYFAVKNKDELPKDDKCTNEEPSRVSFPSSAQKMSFPFSRPLDSCTPNKASSPSQNMLELLHKVDQSRNDGAVTLSSSECNVSSQPSEAEKSDGSGGHIQHDQSSISKGFGLQLGPPSQRLHIPDLSLPSQTARDAASIMHTSHAAAEVGEKMLQTSLVQSFSFPNEGSHYENDRSAGPGHPGDENSLYKAPQNYHRAHGSATPFGRRQLHSKQITRGDGKIAMDEQIDPSFSRYSPCSTQRGFAETALPDASCNIQNDKLDSYGVMAGASDIQERCPVSTSPSGDRIRSFQHSTSQQGASRQVLQKIWNNVPSSQHSLAAQFTKAPSHISVPHQPNIVESSPYGDLHVSKVDHLTSELSAINENSEGVVDDGDHRLLESSRQDVSLVNFVSTSNVEESLDKASSIKDNLEDSPASSGSTQKDIEAFGRSLKPNAFSSKNYALLNQMKALKDSQTDPSIRVSKRIKGPDKSIDACHAHLEAGQQNEDNVGDTLGSSTEVPSQDSRMFSFSASSDMMQRNTSPHGNIASPDIVVAGLDASQSNPSDCTTSVRVQNYQVIPQMAPSWFNQYGPFKNGHMIPVYNAHKVTSLRADEPPSTLGKSASISDAPSLQENSTAAPAGACQVGSSQKSAPSSVSNEHLPSAQSLQLNVACQHQLILRPQKRKTATFELRPWHKEISDGSEIFSVLSAAEGDWNKAANRLTEKVQDDIELIEDGPPLLRSKRRLILTTQLMQQLFSPPPATILSADASSTYESVTYAVSRVALGDACCAVTRSSDLGLRDCLDLHSMKGKLNGDPRFAKVIEELLGKARKLDDDFLRLDKNASVLDLRMECQDMEKFSVINRFAKFHGRGQTDIAEASSSSSSTDVITQNPFVQRYVNAVPMPRDLPDRVQYLSL